MKTMQAIQTHYNGYHFRSRLEARWAVFFDALGIEYQYEPQGFQKEWGDQILHYLPDFYLPKQSIWVEVKGMMTDAEAEKIGMFLDWGCPLPDFNDSAREGRAKGGFLILGDIPNPDGLVFHKLITHHEGLRVNYCTFCYDGFVQCVSSEAAHWLDFFLPASSPDLKPDCFEYLAAENISPAPVVVPSNKAWAKVDQAYLAARQARFKHNARP